MGPKSYKFLRRSEFPFPHSSTLRTFGNPFDLKPGFDIIRIDNTNHSGELLFIIKSTIRFATIDCPATDLFDCMELRVEASHPFILTLIYCRGGPSTLITSDYQQELTSLCNQSLPFFIIGDFNSKHRARNCVQNNKAGKLLKEFLDSIPYFLSYPLENHT